jgi:serine/threonine-protein kinase HipA
MKCLFTYKELQKGDVNYSKDGLKKLNLKLKQMKPFPYTQVEQNRQAQKLAGKISIQGIQPKFSVQLAVQEGIFKIVETGGTFIVKPQTTLYPELPENEDLTMHLAKLAGIQVPWHGLIFSEDKSLSYVIKRFDRIGKSGKLAQEDFAQLIGASRITKYEASMEKVAEILDICTFPTLEKIKLFQRTIFSFLVGNEDMHLKNFSLQTEISGKIQLSPVYDLLNSTIAMSSPEEELALSLRNKKKGFKKVDFELFGKEDLYMTEKRIQKEISSMLFCVPAWMQWIEASFLSKEMKIDYKKLINERAKRLSQ